MNEKATPDELKELEKLRHEYKAAMSVAIDPEEKWRLFRALHELNLCIERLVQQGETAAWARRKHGVSFDGKA